MERKVNQTDSDLKNTYGLFLVIIGCLIVIALFLFKSSMASSGDEIGLFNPIYMYLATKKMTYPIMMQFYTITIHPPMHYLLIALWMKLGLSLRFAIAMMPMIFVLVTFYFLLISPYQIVTKYVIAFALTITIIVAIQNYAVGVRPDLETFIAWAAALITLEGARLKNWSLSQFFIGAFLITYASALHYFATLAVLGIVVYIIWAWYLKLEKRWAITIALIGGAAAFAVPYWIIYVIPNWANIKSMLLSVQNKPSFIQGPYQHIALYHSTGALFTQNAAWFLRGVAFFLKLNIPFVFFNIFLWFRKDFRGFAIASLPMCIFLVLTTWKSTPYIDADLFLLMLTLGFGAAWLIQKILRRLKVQLRWQVGVMAILGLFLILDTSYELRSSFKNNNENRTELARAVGQAILGRSATVGGCLDWYNSGAHQWYSLTPDLYWTHNARLIGINKYFSSFDSLIGGDEEPSACVNPWYLNGTLKLSGFYQSTVGEHYFVLRKARPKQVVGYLYDGKQLMHFIEKPKSPWVFVSALCPFPYDHRLTPFLNHLKYPTYVNMSSMPIYDDHYKLQGNCDDMSKMKKYKNQTLISGLLPEVSYRDFYRQLMDVCQLHDVITGEVSAVNDKKFIADFKAQDNWIDFDRNAVQIDRLYAAPSVPLKAIPDLTAVQFSRGENNFTQGNTLLNMQAIKFLPSAIFSIKANQINHAGWCKLTFEVEKSSVHIQLNSDPEIGSIFVLLRPTHRVVTLYFPIPNIAKFKSIAIGTGDEDHKATMVIKELSIYEKAH